VLERAQAAGVTRLVFTVDLPTPGPRYRDAHSGLSGPVAPARRFVQALAKPSWAVDVGVMGRPHDLGNISAWLGRKVGLEDYIGWLSANMDPSIGWADLEWIRAFWKGPMIIKGVLDGLVWMTKILTDPFHDIYLYHKAPLALMRGELIEQRGTLGPVA